MKIIIDVPKKRYDAYMSGDVIDIYLQWAIQKGTLISEDATNGEVLKELFKSQLGDYYFDESTGEFVLLSDEHYIEVDKKFWNMKFKGGKKK